MSSHVLIAHSLHDWIADLGATRHVARDRSEFVDYRKIPAETSKVFMGNGTSEEASGVGSYQLKLHHHRTDKGREYLSDQFTGLCEEKGMRRQLTIPRTLQQNGIAEKMNRNLLDMSRSMMVQANLPISFWGMHF